MVSYGTYSAIAAVKAAGGIAAFTGEAIAKVWSAMASLTAATAGFGAPAAIALGAGFVATILGSIAMAKNAGDMISPASGTTQISTKEGGLFNMSKNDDILAGPGLAGAMGGGRVDTSKLEALQSETTQKLERVAAVLEGALSGPKPALARAMGAATGDAVEGMA